MFTPSVSEDVCRIHWDSKPNFHLKLFGLFLAQCKNQNFVVFSSLILMLRSLMK